MDEIYEGMPQQRQPMEAIDDAPLSVFAGEREPTLRERLPYAEILWGNVVLEMWR